MKERMGWGVALAFLATGALAQGKASGIENSVVKVFASARYPDYYKPWTKQAPSEVTGSGVVIDGNRILTNAHVVSYASEVQVQANQAGNKVSARVDAISYDIDLAILRIDDPGFFTGRASVPCSTTLPQAKDTVLTYGYPVGGDTQSVTKGIVSRIEYAPYRFDVANPAAGLRIQVDAAINPGNSGGAAVVNNGGKDSMIGITFSVLGGAQNIGYIIPCEEVELFLQDAKDGRYDGKPLLFDQHQTLENAALRAYLKIPKDSQGMLVHKADSPDKAYPLKSLDLISKIGDTSIDDQGMVKLSENTRVGFEYMVQKVVKNGKVPLSIVRDGKPMALDVPVMRRDSLVSDMNGQYPSYFIYGPMVFSPVTMPFIGGFMQQGGGGPMSIMGLFTGPLMRRMLSQPAFPGEQLVVIASPFFPHKLAQGYSNPIGRVVSTVNGVAVKNLKHLVEILRDMRDDYVIIDSEAMASETMVFPRAEMLAATEGILTDNGVRSQGSPDMMEVWNAKGR